MAYIIQKRRWTQQPTCAVEPDLGNPLFNTMSQLFNPVDQQISATGNAIGFRNYGNAVSTSNIQTSGVVIPRLETAAGICWTPYVGSASLAQCVIPAADPNGRLPWTYFCVLSLSATTNSTVCTIAGGGGAFDRELQVFNGTPNFRGYIFTGSAANVDGATKVVTGRQYNVVLSCTSSLLRLWVNGKLDGSLSVISSGFNAYTDPVAFSIGGDGTFNAVGPQIALLGRLNNYAWGNEEAQEWSEYPFQVWLRSPRRLYFPSPLVGDTLLGQAVL